MESDTKVFMSEVVLGEPIDKYQLLDGMLSFKCGIEMIEKGIISLIIELSLKVFYFHL